MKKALPPLPAPHILSPQAYPGHCGARCLLRWDGWRCRTCGATLPFRDDRTGRTWEEQQVPETDFPQQETPS